MLPGSGKTFIDAALAYGAKDRRIAPLGALVAGISIVTINSAIIAATVKKTALSVAPPSGGDLAAGIAGEAGCSRRGGHGTTCQQSQGVVFRQPNFVTPRLVSPFLVSPVAPQDVRYHGTALAWAGTNTFVASLLLGGDCDDGPDIRGKKADI